MEFLLQICENKLLYSVDKIKSTCIFITAGA